MLWRHQRQRGLQGATLRRPRCHQGEGLRDAGPDRAAMESAAMDPERIVAGHDSLVTGSVWVTTVEALKLASCDHRRTQLRCTKQLAPAFSNCARNAFALSRPSGPIRTRYQDMPPNSLVSTNVGSRSARMAAYFCLSCPQAKVASARVGLPMSRTTQAKRGAGTATLACAVGGGVVASPSS